MRSQALRCPSRQSLLIKSVRTGAWAMARRPRRSLKR